MAKVWKKLQRADGDFTGTIDGTAAGTVKDNAATGALKPKTFRQASIPTSVTIGDIWYDTDDNNIAYFADSVGANEIKAGEWVQVKQGKGANTYTKDDVGLSNLTNHTQIKEDGSNAPNSLLNSQITVDKDSSGNISLNNAGSGSISLNNSDVGLSNVTNHEQIKSDGSNAPDGLKNAQITLTASGGTVTLNNAGSGSIDKGDIGLGSVDDKSMSEILGGELTGTIKTDVTIGGTTVNTIKSNASDGASAKGITDSAFTDDSGTPKLNVANANDGLKNNQISLSASGGTVSLSGASTTNNSFTKTSIGLGSVDDKSMSEILAGDLTGKVGSTGVSDIESGASDGTAAKTITDDTFEVVSGVNTIKDTRAPASLKNASISISSSGGTVTVSGIASGSNTFGKTDVGLDKVVNQKVAVVGGKIQLDDTDQTLDADTVGGDSKDTIKSAAVTTATSNIVGTSPGVLDTLTKISTSLGNQSNAYNALTTSIGTKAIKPVTITDPSATPSDDVGVQGIYNDELYVVQDV